MLSAEKVEGPLDLALFSARFEGLPQVLSVGVEGVDQLVGRHLALRLDRLQHFFIVAVHWRDRAEDHDDPVIETLLRQLPEVHLVRCERTATNVVGAEHDQRYLGIEIRQPRVHVLVCPADCHPALVSIFGTPSIPAILEHVSLNRFEGSIHVWVAAAADVFQSRPESL